MTVDEETAVLNDAIEQELDVLVRFACLGVRLPGDRVASLALLTGLTTTDVIELFDSIRNIEVP